MITFCRVSKANKLLGESNADKRWAFVNCILEYRILHLLSCVYICLCFRTHLTKEESGPRSHPHPCSNWFHANIHDFNSTFILESEKCFVFHAKYRRVKKGRRCQMNLSVKDEQFAGPALGPCFFLFSAFLLCHPLLKTNTKKHKSNLKQCCSTG